MTARVVVVGAGVAGLATAYRLSRADDPPDVLVLEAADSPGGKVRSAVVGGLELEAGPDSLLARKPWAVDLCRELGLGDDLVAPAPVPTHIYTEKGLLRFPSGPFGISTDPVELARWPGLSYAGKVRAGGDLVLPRRREDGDESLGSLLRRRIGDEATETLVAPLLGGLFAGDIDRLSVLATFPEIAAWEREHGSITRGARAQTKAAAARRTPGSGPAPMFLRLRGGLRRLTDALASAIGHERVRLGTPVAEVTRHGDAYAVRVDGAEIRADAVVFATPAFATERLLSSLAPEARQELAGIPYVSTAVVLLVYPEGTGDRLPESSGFVSPRGRLAITAATLVSRKWPDPALGTRAVVRCFIGAWGMEESLALPDDELIERVDDQIAEIFDLSARPEAVEVVRWPVAMPQYEVGHLDRVARIEAAIPPATFVVGQAYRGAGIPDCVRQANETAERVLAALSPLRA
ncbi:MAG TPA: protoporphyrinogen oxidase [Actinomycetota bacterium]|nr:protoporphyrinogen oxidase [Actinomycetota bacterium]